jgi:hypothetical protein
MNDEAPEAFASITKYIDPHRVCEVIDVCPRSTAFDNVS